MIYRAIKRLVDILLSGIALFILLPILLPTMLILLCTGEHYVFYFQDRIGKGGKNFKIWKFATMLVNSPNLGTGMITLRNDPRVMPFGRILRMLKINELPQLINIFKGDMTLVGPRPLVKQNFDKYTPEVREIIGKCTPGLTGIGSIVFRDEERLLSDCKTDPKQFYAEVIAPFKGELELWYHKHQNLWVDWKIILLTAIIIINSESQLVYRFFPDLPKWDDYLQQKQKSS